MNNLYLKIKRNQRQIRQIFTTNQPTGLSFGLNMNKFKKLSKVWKIFKK